MPDININFNDFMQSDNRGTIILSWEREIDNQVIEFPVIWSGYVSTQPVRIRQNRRETILPTAIVWEELPATLEHAKADIIEAIEQYLRNNQD